MKEGIREHRCWPCRPITRSKLVRICNAEMKEGGDRNRWKKCRQKWARILVAGLSALTQSPPWRQSHWQIRCAGKSELLCS